MSRTDTYLRSTRGYIITSVVYHLLYVFCALDVYYRSPIQDIGGMGSHKTDSNIKAKRVVFITMDGAPADVVFSGANKDLINLREGGEGMTGKVTAPFLNKILSGEKGNTCWGVTHTHVPTESRPGHVALIAGLYEDPSAVTTGWQYNSNTSFDTAWKESRSVWQWGAPEIVNIFSAAPHIHTFPFPDEMNDFALNPETLDSWVAANLTSFLSSTETQNNPDLHKSEIIFFLHFLAMDSAGHKFGTASSTAGYYETLSNLDRCLEDSFNAIKNFYGDEDTAFVITADHGMTKRGSHGDGSPEETRVPIIVFGAGVSEDCLEGSNPEVLHSRESFSSIEEENSFVKSNWGLNPNTRLDMQAADVSMLLSALSGVPYATHSEGVVPTRYLSSKQSNRFHALFANLRQARERLLASSNLRESRTFSKTLFFKWEFENSIEQRFSKLNLEITNTPAGIDLDSFIDDVRALLEMYQQGALYYRHYDYRVMIVGVAVAYIVWNVFSLCVSTELVVRSDRRQDCQSGYLFEKIIALVVYAAIVPTLWAIGLRFRDIAYCVAPLHLVPFVIKSLSRLSISTSIFNTIIGLTITSSLLIIITYSFHNRSVLTVGSILVSVMFIWTRDYKLAISFLVLSIFPSLPCVGTDYLYIVSPTGISVSSIAVVVVIYKQTKEYLLPAGCYAAASFVVWYSDSLRHRGVDPGVVSSSFGWIVFVTSLVMPRLHGSPSLLLQLSCLGPPLLLLSVGYESILYIALVVTLITSEQFFKKLNGPTSVSMGSLTLTSLLYYCFFSTGNIASVSSFDLPSVYRLQSHYDKGLMGVLLVIKILIPLLAVVTAMRSFFHSQRYFFAVFTTSIALSDVIALYFFCCLETEGSWKQIGHSISCFVITNLLTLILLILWFVSFLFVPMKNIKIAVE